MKLKTILFVIIFLSIIKVSAQTIVPFSNRLPSGNLKIKGDVTMIGNNILGKAPVLSPIDANLPNNVNGINDGQNFEYIDVDNDASTFSSSTADLNLVGNCRKIAFAGLYWSATYPYGRAGLNPDGTPSSTIGTPRLSTFNEIKLKLPGTLVYQNLTADNNPDVVGQEDQIIFDGYNAANPANSVALATYLCYKNITSLVQAIPNPNGTYAIADMIAARGVAPLGNSGGWTIVIIYEDPALTSKSINILDGFSVLSPANTSVNINVNGFTTLPAPASVRASIGVVALEGERGVTGETVSIKGNAVPAFANLSNSTNPIDDFFNSTVSINDAVVATRNPASQNTLGFDQDIIQITNPANSVIGNGETGASYRLSYAGDTYFPYLTIFAVETLEPKIALTKIVTDNLGNSTGSNVVLGQQLNYLVGFQNIGNDNAVNFTIKDILPLNINFNYPADLILPVGVTATYNVATRTLLFTIPNSLVEKNDPRYEIIIRVKVVGSCYEVSTACSNIIRNQAFSKYSDATNTIQITDDPSYANFTSCLEGSPAPTNFIIGLADCEFKKNEILCGTSLTLTAAAGYSSYSWSTSATGSPVISTSQSLVVNTIGTYYVSNTAPTNCVSIKEIITVIPFGNNVTNPVIPYADEVAICPNDGKQLPNIFLCGLNDSQLIQTNIQNALSIKWSRLNTGSCPAVPNAFCANENVSCVWTEINSGPNYTANTPGEYKVVISYQGGCFNIFYFNVYQNSLSPTAVTRDIICNTQGRIQIDNVPNGYEYSFTTASIPGTYSSSNILNTNTVGVYNVFIRQIGVGANACVFQILGLPIVNRIFSTSVFVTPINCNGTKATIKIAANNILPQYTYTLSQGAATISTSGLINAADFTFTGVDPGTYTITTISQDGCTDVQTVTITTNQTIGAIATITRALTPCSTGEITFTATDGVPPYEYRLGTTGPFTSISIPYQIPIGSSSTLSFEVNDTSNCPRITLLVPVNTNPAPVFNVVKTNVICYGATTGQIVFNVSNNNGYTLQYSINNGVTFSSSNTFSNLLAGPYRAVLRYSLNTASCTTASESIIITQPDTALTASGGVSEVACDSNGGLGKIRITNPQGGVAPYQYNLGVGYQSSTVRSVVPGNYIISIRDANNCVYTMSVTVDPIPQMPTIAVQTPVFNCIGTATSSVIVNNGPSNYAYTYSINGVLNTPPTNNVFTGVNCGNNIFSVNYQATTFSTYSTLLYEDFGSGPNTTTPGIAAAYCWNYQPFPPGQPCSINPVVGYPPADCSGTGPYGSTYVLEDNQYVVTSGLNPNICVWYDYRDHTSNGLDPNGRFLAVNIGNAAGNYGVLYSKVINDVIPNQPILVDLYLTNMIKSTLSGFVNPDFIIELVTNPGNVFVASIATGQINNNVDAWRLKSLSLNPGNNTSLRFNLRSGSTDYYGNDAAIDDISVYQLPVACVNQRNFPTNIPCNQAFSAQVINPVSVTCAGANNGQLTITAQNFRFPQGFEYSLNGGTSWLSSSFSPVTITGLAAATYNVQVRYDSLSVACAVTSTQTISSPATLDASAIVTTPATCLVGATITASGIGGTAPYQYQLTNAAGTVNITPYQSPATFTNVPAGSYLIRIIDANGCIDPINAPITVSPAIAPTATVSVSSTYCVTATGGELVVTATGGTPGYQYNINGGVFQNSNTFSNLLPGTYAIIVRDSYGCTFPLTTQLIAPQLTLNLGLPKDLDCTLSPDAIISGTIVGGYAPFTYTIAYNSGTPSAPISVAATTFTRDVSQPGTYLFIITDSRGCVAQSTQIINTLTNPAVAATITNITCNIPTGTVILNASQGISPYFYSFNGSAFTSVNTYSGLALGSYNYQVRDSKFCVTSGSATITGVVSVSGTAVVVTPYSCLGTATISAQGVIGGTTPYQYSIGGAYQASSTFSGLVNGTYTISIRDANNCIFVTNAVTLAPLSPPTDLSFVATAITCPSNTSNVTITPTGTNTPYNYQITAPAGAITASQTSNIFTNLAAGTYRFLITDSNSCTYFEDYTINAITPIAVLGQNIANVQCFGTPTGAVRFTVSGFTTNYSYSINGNPIVTAQTASTINLTALIASSYTIIVTDNNTNCTATATAVVTEPASALATSILDTPITCFASGSVIVLSTIGGWGGNSYTLTQPTGPVLGPQPTGDFANLTAIGTYTLNTSDLNGCVVSSSFTLIAAATPSGTISASSTYCVVGSTGATLIVDASGGNAPYEYNINGGGFQTSNTFSNLAVGSYVIIVRDDFGCTFTLPSESIQPQLTLTASLDKDLDCTLLADAIIKGTILGGYSPFTYTIAYNAGVPSASTAVIGNTFTSNATAAGSYLITITDSKGCTSQATQVIAPLISPDIISVSQTIQILCNGQSTAAINVVLNPAAGTGPFVINVLNTTTNVNYGTQTSGLAAGNYTITATDSKLCSATKTIVITEPSPISFDVTISPIICTGTGTSYGTISVSNVLGGTAGYTYILTSNNSTLPQTIVSPTGASATFTVLNFGIYEVNVIDSNSCVSTTRNIIMSSPPNDLIISTSVPVADCLSGGTIVVTVNASPLSPLYYFAIYPGTALAYPDPAYQVGNPYSATFTGLTPGVTYSFIVYDPTTNCYYFKEATAPIPTLSTLTSTIDLVNNVTCNGSGNANVNFTFSNYLASSVRYQIFNSQSNIPVTASTTLSGLTGAPTTVTNAGPLPPGNYYILFTEIGVLNNGCTNASPLFSITQSALALSLTATVIKNDNCNLNAGQVAINALGGTSPYTYQLLLTTTPVPLASTPGWVTGNTFNVESGNYFAYVKDANGCIQSTPVVVILDPTPTITTFSIINCSAVEGNQTINVQLATPGIAPYTFSLDGGAFQNQTPPFSYNNINSGSHTVIVKDVNGCSASSTITIYPPLLNTLAATALPSCANNNGIITVTAQGGTGTYGYTISPNVGITQVGNVFSGAAAGTYAVTLTDTLTTCSVTINITLGAATPVTFTTTLTNVSCASGTNGSITVNLPASNNNPVYSYQIGILAPQPSNVFTGLAAGTYAITVNSARGCSATTNVTITQPTPIAVSASATAFVCNASNAPSTSTVTLTAVGGTPAYSYSINGTNYGIGNTFTLVSTGATQTITVYTKDLNSCIASTIVTIFPLPTITAVSVSQTAAISCKNDEQVTINVTGGSGNYSYQLLPSGIAQASNVFALTAAGTYNFLVTDTTTGCTFAVAPYNIVPFNNATVTASQQAAVLCFGQNNGAININVIGYAGLYTYNVLNASNVSVASATANTTTNPQLVTGLIAGNYTVQVIETASPECTITSNLVTVGTPAAALSNSVLANINANCNINAQVTAQGAGGTVPYTYAFVIAASGAPIATAYSASATAILNPITSANWDIYVKDANGCVASTTVTVVRDAQPTIVLPPFTDNQCTSTGNSFTFTAVATGLAPLTYSIGNGFVASPTFTVTAAGLYTVIVKDVNGCSASSTITIYPPLLNTLTATALPSCANNNGIITVTAQGGTGTYGYTISPNVGITQVGNVFSGAAAGTYAVTLTDTLTTCSVTTNITLGAATPVTINNVIAQNVICNNGTDGSITVNLVPTAVGINDNPVYRYSIISGPVTRPLQFSNVFSNLPEGDYIISVLSERLCVVTQTIRVSQPNPIIVPNATAVEFACNVGSNLPNFATVSVSGVIGGSGIYNIYQFIRNGVVVQSSSATTFIESNLTGGSYTINVFDDRGCVGATAVSAVINPFVSISNIAITVNNAITCNTLETITVLSSPSSGSPTISYTVIGQGTSTYNQTNTTGSFTGLAIGNYQITATNTLTGCSVLTYHIVDDPNTFKLNIQNLTSVICYGSNEGSVSVTFVDLQPIPTNNAGGFTYVVSGPTPSSGTSATAGPFTISNLSAGIYSITATLSNSPRCPVTFGFTVQQPDLPLSVSASQTSSVTCLNNAGVIIANANGGWPGVYQYALSGAATVGFSSNNVFSNLSAGNYVVRVRDINGCVVSTPIILLLPTPISASISTNVTSLLCNGNETGVVTVSNTIGGQGSGYLYTLNYLSFNPILKSGPLATNVFANLAAGSYSVTIQDAYSCSYTTAVVTITEPTEPKANLSILTPQSCQNQAVLILTGSGGTPPYTYGTDGVNFSTVTFNPSTTFAVPVGTFKYFIKDANGCISSTVSNDVQNAAIVSLTAVITSAVAVNCYGGNTGSIAVSANGGLGNYIYVLRNLTTGVTSASQTTGSFSGLFTGNYQVFVTSLDCNYLTPIIAITQPSAPLTFTPNVIPVSCNGAGDGKVVIINPSGGTGQIKFAISPNLDQFVNTNSFVGLAVGVYDMIIQDANGCFVTYNFTISEPGPLTSSLQAITQQELCFNDRNGSFVFNIAGGTLPYRYSVDSPTGPFITGGVTQTQFTVNGLTGGTHTVYVKDFNGCDTSPLVVVMDQSVFINAVVTPNIFCPDDAIINNVVVTVNPAVLSLVTYSLDGGPYLPQNTFVNLTPGSHYINVRHPNGCITPNINFVITALAPVTLNLSQGGLNEIIAITSGGNGGYTYNVNGVNYGSTSNFIINQTGNYTVTVTDSRGCDAVQVIPMVFVDIFVPNVFTPNNDGINDGWSPQNTANYRNLVFYIFDRYGRKIATRNEGETWDGTYNGNELPSGDYWYLIKVNGEKPGETEYVGHFTLYR